MKAAVLGSGGREHAIAWKLEKSPELEKVFCLPGNGGTVNNILVDVMDFKAIEDVCKNEGIELLIVGPEAPLAAGIKNHFKDKGIRVFGPDREAAKLESSKIFAKRFMQKYNVATAPCLILDRDSADRETQLKDIKARLNGNCVVKYDGLAGGKGVFVCSNKAEFDLAIATVTDRYGDQAPLLIEERLIGDEVSILAFTDGKEYKLLLPSQDHKQLKDGDRGPNTGGMGAFCPVPGYSTELDDLIRRDIIEPTIKGIEKDGLDYCGVLYFGLMITSKGPQVLEYNIRLGDPETEAVLPALRSDLYELIDACLENRLSEIQLEFEPGYFVDVVIASGGYPGEYNEGHEIKGWINRDLLFWAGAEQKGNSLVTAGGRVLNVVGQGESLAEAIDNTYRKVFQVKFRDMYYRRDIGKRDNPMIRSYSGT